jgi:hypothetical protein
MIRHWTAFESGPYQARTRKEPRVTIHKDKKLMLNRAACEALGDPPAIRLYFDKGANCIGLAATSPDEAFAFPMHQRDNLPYRFVRAGSFCVHFGIEPTATMAFHDVSVDKDGIMTLDLTTAIRVGKGAR